MARKIILGLFHFVHHVFYFGKKKDLLKTSQIELNEEQIKFIAAGAVVGFLQFWENREREFYKQLNKMKLWVSQ